MHRRLMSMSYYAFPLCPPLLLPSFLTHSMPHHPSTQIAVGHCRCMIRVLFPPFTYPPSTRDQNWSRRGLRIHGLHQHGAPLRIPLPPRLVRRTGQLGQSFPRSMTPMKERDATAMLNLLPRYCMLIYDRTRLLRVGQGIDPFRLHPPRRWNACRTCGCLRRHHLLLVDSWHLEYQERRTNSCLLRLSLPCIDHQQDNDTNMDTQAEVSVPRTTSKREKLKMVKKKRTTTSLRHHKTLVFFTL